MKAICTIKKTGEVFETRAEKVNNKWVIGGDVPEYKTVHYVIISKGIEYELKNGRLKQA